MLQCPMVSYIDRLALHVMLCGGVMSPTYAGWVMICKRLLCRQKWPLLVLHGGPGLPSRYLETLELLAGQDRQIIFYDQVCPPSRIEASLSPDSISTCP